MPKYNIVEAGPDSRLKRRLVANALIFDGESILEERPLLCSQYLWNAEYKYAACEFCLAPLESAQENVRRLTNDSSIDLPYATQCCEVNKSTHVLCACGTRYCSSICREQAQTIYHKILCPAEPANARDLSQSIEKLCDFWKSIHYPPESVCIMLVVKILAYIRQSENALESIGKINELARAGSGANEVEMIHKLLGEKYQEQIVIIREMISRIVFDPILEPFFTDRGFVQLLALVIGRRCQTIGTSSFSKWAENCERAVANEPPDQCRRITELIEQLFERMDKNHGPFLNCEGSGLYPLSGVINHSCAPNAQIQFPYSNHLLVVRAIDNIDPGDEICISFLDDCMRFRSRHTRIKYLRENFFLDCNCAKCVSQLNDPDETSEEEEDSSSDAQISDDDDDDEEKMNCD